ncbi:Multidrug resistance outer membrane protein MdtP precursor [Raoultella terrigena]|uniref:Multidrug resistance outer membrane protein MdtP n=1 Tax=Raoultella terrigena TaxID=577 RepID=A0A4U9CZV3_RAOTE|nr:Multidrug resistance outer membrane protein MdtP precursor [Raoultella terrigena]
MRRRRRSTRTSISKAFWGYNALSVGDLFKSTFQQINLLPGLYLPIFDGGRLNANLRSVRTASNILIKAVQPGRPRCRSRRGDKLQPAQRSQPAGGAPAAEGDRRHGHHPQRQRALSARLLSYYAAQEARRPAIAQRLMLLDIQAQRLSTDVTLIKALGGDYRSPLAEVSEK